MDKKFNIEKFKLDQEFINEKYYELGNIDGVTSCYDGMLLMLSCQEKSMSFNMKCFDLFMNKCKPQKTPLKKQ